MDVDITQAGEVAIGSSVGATSGARLDLFDRDGVGLWTRAFADANGGTINAQAWIAAEDGGFVMSGRVTRGPLQHPIVVRFDSIGEVLWTSEYVLDAAAGIKNGEAVDLIELDDGRLAVTGRVDYEDQPGVNGTIRFTNAMLMVLSPDGDLDWALILGNVGFGYATTLAQVDGGDLVFVGKIDGEEHSSWIGRVTADGTFLWSTCVAGEYSTGNDEARGVVAAPGGVVVCGTSGIGPATESWLCKLDQGGDVVWFKTMRGPDQDVLFGVDRLETGIIAWGFTRSLQPLGAGGAETESWIVRTGFDGMLHYDPANGFDALNDLRGQSPTFDVIHLPMAGVMQSLTLVETTSVQAFDPTSALVTLLTL